MSAPAIMKSIEDIIRSRRHPKNSARKLSTKSLLKSRFASAAGKRAIKTIHRRAPKYRRGLTSSAKGKPLCYTKKCHAARRTSPVMTLRPETHEDDARDKNGDSGAETDPSTERALNNSGYQTKDQASVILSAEFDPPEERSFLYFVYTRWRESNSAHTSNGAFDVLATGTINEGIFERQQDAENKVLDLWHQFHARREAVWGADWGVMFSHDQDKLLSWEALRPAGPARASLIQGAYMLRQRVGLATKNPQVPVKWPNEGFYYDYTRKRRAFREGENPRRVW